MLFRNLIWDFNSEALLSLLERLKRDLGELFSSFQRTAQ